MMKNGLAYGIMAGRGRKALALLCLAGLSLKFTSHRCRELNGFSWAPIEEVAKLFFGIFIILSIRLTSVWKYW